MLPLAKAATGRREAPPRADAPASRLLRLKGCLIMDHSVADWVERGKSEGRASGASAQKPRAAPAGARRRGSTILSATPSDVRASWVICEPHGRLRAGLDGQAPPAADGGRGRWSGPAES